MTCERSRILPISRNLRRGLLVALTLPHLAAAEVDPSAYLVARQAAMQSDFARSAAHFADTLRDDPTNPYLLESSLSAHVSLGQFDQAIALANTMHTAQINSQLGRLVRQVAQAQSGDWAAIFDALEAGEDIGPLVDGLAQGWAFVGQGQVTRALATFDDMSLEPGLRGYARWHKALALAAVGDFEGANDLFVNVDEGGLLYTARRAMAHAEILSQLGKNDQAHALLTRVFGTNADDRIGQMKTALLRDDVLPYTFAKSAQTGLAEVYFDVAQAVRDEASQTFVLQFIRAAVALNPQNADAILFAAETLERLEQYTLATATYRQIPEDHPTYQNAELGRSEALRKSGKQDAALEVLEALQRRYPNIARIKAAIGDLARSNEDYARAQAAYSGALDIYADSDPLKPFIYFSRGIAFHKTDDWPKAEADFRAALALRPDDAQVLNYLGYSLVERGLKIEEATAMIETAVRAQPDNGAIVDSLGWVLFERGQYAEAVIHLERAASLMAVDPVINDHLGDAYWAVGRFNEAAFQWNRALSFDATETDAARIRLKLELGLDAVLKAEGAAPLRATDDDG